MSHTINEQAKSSRPKRPTPGDRTETLPERRRTVSGSLPAEPAVTPLPAEPTPGAALTSPPADAEALPTDDPNRYELAGEHARGGLGRILKARDRRLGRTVAVKELIARSGENELRFVREALITARLQHPGIVPVHEAGRWPSGEPYYVMKLISGQSLRELVAERKSLGERLSLLPNVIAVAEAIGYAHSQGVIHRDLKPSNIVVGEFGETVVVDWGLAKDLRAPDGQELTGASLASSPEIVAAGAGATADVIGTPAYMPPEQAEGGQVDERTDVYAIGAVLYHLLSGEAPYAGDDSGDIVSRVLSGPPVPVDLRQPGLAPDLVAIIGKAMARVPGERYRTAKELAEDLKRFQTGKLVTAHDYSTWTLLRRWLRMYRAPMAVAAVGVAILAMIGVLAVNRIIDERNLARTEREQAQSAQRSTEERSQQLLFLQAQTSFDRDPTAALAWLKQYPHDGPQYREIPGMIDRARTSGVARHVFRHADWAYDVVFSPDGNHAASASKDGKVMRWDLTTGEGELLLDAHYPVRAIAFSPDGSRLAVGDYVGAIKLMTLANRQVIAVDGHKAGISWLAFTPDSQLLVSAGEADGSSRIWRVSDGVLHREFSKPRGENMRFSDDGQFYGMVDEDGMVTIRATATDAVVLKRPMPWPGPDRRGQGGALASDGKTALWIGAQGNVHALRPGSTGWEQVGTVEGAVTRIVFSPSSKLAAIAGSNGTITLWDIATSAQTFLRGHVDSIYEVTFSADERQLVSASDDGTARVWDLRSGASHTLLGHQDDVLKARFSPDGSWIATASLDRTVRIWPTRFDESRPLVGHASGFVGRLRYVRGAGGETGLITQAIGSQALAWDLATGVPARVGEPWPGPGFPSWQDVWPAVISAGGRVAAAREAGGIDLLSATDGAHVLGRDGERYHAIAFSPDDRLVVAATPEKAVMVWQLDGDDDARQLVPAESSSVYALAFSPTGDVLAVIGADGVRLWNMAEGKVTRRLATPTDARWTRGLFSADGSKLALISRQGRFTIWEPATGERADFHTDEHSILDVAFSPDGRRIAAAVADRTVRVWDLARGGDPQVLTGHTDLVLAVEFSPDGGLLASGSYDRTLRLWKVGSWESRVLYGHSSSVDAIDFSPDGRQLASISRDGQVKLWAPALETDPVPSAITDQLSAITTAVIGADDKPQTPR